MKKTDLRTNAGNAIPVRTRKDSQAKAKNSKSVGHARKSIWWMPWH